MSWLFYTSEGFRYLTSGELNRITINEIKKLSDIEMFHIHVAEITNENINEIIEIINKGIIIKLIFIYKNNVDQCISCKLLNSINISYYSMEIRYMRIPDIADKNILVDCIDYLLHMLAIQHIKILMIEEDLLNVNYITENFEIKNACDPTGIPMVVICYKL